MPNYPFFGFKNRYFPYKYYNYSTYKKKYNPIDYISKTKSPYKELEEAPIPPSTNLDNEALSKGDQFFSILGIRLYFDDLIILALLFFLYNEKVKDEGLFLCLILLLLS